MKVLIDAQAFFRHGRSGITRYFTELIREFTADPALQVAPVTPYRYVANAHVSDMAPGSYRRVPMPPQARPGVLKALNARQRRRFDRDVDLIHHTLYLPDGLLLHPGVLRVCTVYDFILELYRDLFPDSQPLLERTKFLAIFSELTDEFYQVKNFSREKSHVVLRLDTSKLPPNQNLISKNGDFPLAWAKMYGQGRVFYGSFAHDAKTWDNPDVYHMYFEALKWALKLSEADITPRPLPASTSAAAK